MKSTQTVPTSLLAHGKRFTVASTRRREAIDIRSQVEEVAQSARVQHGVVLVNCLHTTCSVIIADSAGEGLDDFVGLMGRFIQEGSAYRHNDLRWSDCERGNAAAHLRASLLGLGQTIGITEGALALDKSQSILLTEWDGPRSRTVDVQILGG